MFRQILSKLILVMFVFFVSQSAIFSAGKDAPKTKPALVEELILGFDKIEGIVEKTDEPSPTDFETVKFDKATEGKTALKIDFQSGDYPGIRINMAALKKTDVSSYKSIYFDVINDGPALECFATFLEDKKGDRVTVVDDFAIKKGVITIKINLLRAKRKVDLKNLKVIAPFVPLNGGNPVTLYIDNLRLVK